MGKVGASVGEGLRRVLVVALPMAGGIAIGQETNPGATIYGSGLPSASTQDVTVYGPMELERRGSANVEDILATDKSIQMVRTAGPAGRTSTFIQGIDSDHILFLIDGIEVNDPISPGRNFEFSQMPSADIERIEIIKSGDGIRYGSGANGAVVNIVTKKGAQAKNLRIGVEGGSFGTVKSSANVSYGTKDYDLNLAIGGSRSDGISAASEKFGNDERDGYLSRNVSGRARYRAAGDDWLDVSLRYQLTDTELDNSGGVGGDDPNHIMTTKESSYRAQYEYGLPRDRWSARIFAGGHQLERTDENQTDADHPTSSLDATYDGQMVTAGVDQSLRVGGLGTLNGGIGHKQDEGSSKESAAGDFSYESEFPKKSSKSDALWVQFLNPGQQPMLADVGARVEEHDLAGTMTGYHLGLGARFFERQTLLRVRLERGFKVPTIFQLYSPYGSPDLGAEASLSWNAAIEQSAGPVEIQLGVFKHLLRNLVDFDPVASKYQNIGSVQSYGYELSVDASPVDDVTVKVGYSRTEHRNNETDRPLLRRARHKASIDASYFAGPKTRLTATLVHVGSRPDKDFSGASPVDVVLPAYDLLGASVNYKTSSSSEIYVRGENLADADYQEVFGYGTPGRAGFLGARLDF